MKKRKIPSFRSRERWLQIPFIILAVTSIIYGSMRKEAEVVLQKAINICLECVGLG